MAPCGTGAFTNQSETSNRVSALVVKWNCDSVIHWLMRNITVSVPDSVYRAARMRAAERDTSVSALVAEFLATLSGGEEFGRLEDQQRRIVSEIKRFRASDRLERVDLHDRALH